MAGENRRGTSRSVTSHRRHSVKRRPCRIARRMACPAQRSPGYHPTSVSGLYSEVLLRSGQPCPIPESEKAGRLSPILIDSSPISPPPAYTGFVRITPSLLPEERASSGANIPLHLHDAYHAEVTPSPPFTAHNTLPPAHRSRASETARSNLAPSVPLSPHLLPTLGTSTWLPLIGPDPRSSPPLRPPSSAASWPLVPATAPPPPGPVFAPHPRDSNTFAAVVAAAFALDTGVPANLIPGLSPSTEPELP